jgi:hypothetical protein
VFFNAFGMVFGQYCKYGGTPTLPSWFSSPLGEGEDGRWIRQVSVKTFGSGVSATMCAVRVDELLRKLEDREWGNAMGSIT